MNQANQVSKDVIFPDGEFTFKDIKSDLSLSSVRIKLKEALVRGDVVYVRSVKPAMGAFIKVYSKK